MKIEGVAPTAADLDVLRVLAQILQRLGQSERYLGLIRADEDHDLDRVALQPG